MDIVISTQVTPTFAQIGPLCQNSTAPALPGTSSNGFAGTWSPSTINTANVGTTTYTFTPTDPCATIATMNIVISTQITPTFAAVAPICSGVTINALPTTSNNGITGTWTPALNNTATTTYTFTPAAGQCATTTTLTITVNPQVTPTFAQIGPLCQNSVAPALPATSINGFAGTWSPSTINTATAGTTTYTFTPTDPCAAVTKMDIMITTTNLIVTNPAATCSSNKIDLTAQSITAGSDPGLTYTYWTNNSATIVLASPTAVSTSGTYYIKATSVGGCSVIKPVLVTINNGAAPNIVITNPAPVCAPATVNLTSPAIIAGSDQGLTYTYWIDAANTIPVPDPKAVKISGTYYITGKTTGGCSLNKSVPVVVKINTAVSPMRYPTVTTSTNTPVNLSARDLGSGVSYLWQPPVGLNSYNIKNPTFNYNRETEYTVTLTPNDGSCPTVDTILVKIVDNNALRSSLSVPKAWSPNGDGHNDKLYPLTINMKELKSFRIYNRWGQLVFETKTLGQGWDGTYKGIPQVTDVYTWTVEAIGLDGLYYKQAGNSILMR
jgi:gliding motility-associated-like protein